MSWIGDAFSAIKRVIELDSDVKRLGTAVEVIKADLTDHDRRLIRIETVIEFGRPQPPSPPRLPRR